MTRTEDELRQKEEELGRLREKTIKEEQARKDLENSQTELIQEKNQLFIQLQRVRVFTSQAIEQRAGVTSVSRLYYL